MGNSKPDDKRIMQDLIDRMNEKIRWSDYKSYYAISINGGDYIPKRFYSTLKDVGYTCYRSNMWGYLYFWRKRKGLGKILDFFRILP